MSSGIVSGHRCCGILVHLKEGSGSLRKMCEVQKIGLVVEKTGHVGSQCARSVGYQYGSETYNWIE